jgi:hypothetical protein
MSLYTVLPDYDFDFLNFADLARCAAAILRRDDADIVRLSVAALPLTFAQRAR